MNNYTRYQIAVALLALSRATKKLLVAQAFSKNTEPDRTLSAMDVIDARIDLLVERVAKYENQALREGAFINETKQIIERVR